MRNHSFESLRLLIFCYLVTSAMLIGTPRLAAQKHDLGLVIRHAKIGTYLNQVVDVFYVTARAGQKICDGGYLDHIKHEMFRAAEAK